jgi:hypothetical protein
MEAARRSASYAAANSLHDITSGNNTVQLPPETITGFQAAPGWDLVTGTLRRLLAHWLDAASDRCPAAGRHHATGR